VVTGDLGASGWPSGVCARPGGDGGRLVRRQSCSFEQGEKAFLEGPGGRSLTDDLWLAKRLACLGQVGVMGCGYEQQLAAVARAVDPALHTNPGFLRPDAHLAILLLSDEDDCSAPPDTTFYLEDRPGEFAELRCSLAGHVCRGSHPPAAPFQAPLADCEAAEDGPLVPIKALVERVRASKAEPDRQITVAGIFGDPSAYPTSAYVVSGEPYGPNGLLGQREICESANGWAEPGLRLASFIRAFGRAGTTGDICGDLLAELARAGQSIAADMTSTCAPQSVSSCQVTAGELALPACQEGGLYPCWRLEADAGCRSSRQRLRLVGAARLPAGITIEASCLPE
jgi:hypothetical protein